MDAIERDRLDAALACSLGDEDLAARLRAWRDLGRESLVERKPTPGGFTATYLGDDATAAALAALVEAERDCCPGIQFRVAREDGRVRLDVEFPSA